MDTRDWRFFGGFALGAFCFIVVFVNWRWVRTFVLELSVLFVNLRWVRFGDARCAFFYEFASGAHWPLGVLCVFCGVGRVFEDVRWPCARWVRFGDARCAIFYEFASGAHWSFGVMCIFCEFALGACWRTCVGHMCVGRRW